jgi:hypothetical protein
MSDPSDRLERAIAQLGAEHEPPPGWEARVLAAIEPQRTAAPERRPWLRRWWPAIPTAVLAAAVLVLVLRPPRPEKLAVAFAVTAGDPSRGAMRGEQRSDDVTLGSRLDLAVRGGGGHRALWLYRDGGLVAACPGDARCDTAGGAPHLALTASQIGRYQIVVLTADAALPAPSGNYDRDVAALLDARIEIATKDCQVR